MSNEQPSAISEEVIEVCRELMDMDTEMDLDWTKESRSLYTFVLSIGNEESWVKTDMYHLTGLYVAFGPQLFNMIDHMSDEDEHSFLSYLTRKYKILEDQKVLSPSIRVSDIIRHFPFYVAEHLHLGRGLSYGNLYGLPRCLAFSGGFHLIPAEPEWDSLTMMWKAWRSSYPICETECYSSRRYMQLVYVPTSKEIRDQIMAHFRIVKPTVQETLKAIEGAVRDRLANSYYVSLGVVFLCYESEIKNYYKMFSGQELDFNLLRPSSVKNLDAAKTQN